MKGKPAYVIFVATMLLIPPNLWAGPVFTGPPCAPNEPGRGGLVAEFSRVQNASFDTVVTNNSGAIIGTMHLNTINIPGDGSTALGVVPAVFMGQPACDAG